MAEPTANDVRKVLNTHGHAFQYAVLRRAQELFEQRLSTWVFDVAEFPVDGTNKPIHIDFVLRSRSNNVYLVIECKRVDPALGNWCFLKLPYTRCHADESELILQEVQYQPPNVVRPLPRVRHASIECSHLGFELRADAKGEGVTKGAAINDATTQVLRGSNGLIDRLFAGPGRAFEKPGCVTFIPVIFTTARLWIAKGDLSAADLATGQLPKDWGTLTSVQWLWYTYNQSPALSNGLPSSTPDMFDLSAALQADCARTIAVVGPDGVDAFLRWNLPEWLW